MWDRGRGRELHHVAKRGPSKVRRSIQVRKLERRTLKTTVSQRSGSASDNGQKIGLDPRFARAGGLALHDETDLGGVFSASGSAKLSGFEFSTVARDRRPARPSSASSSPTSRSRSKSERRTTTILTWDRVEGSAEKIRLLQSTSTKSV